MEYGAFALLGSIVVIIYSAIWIVFPFAVFGIKKRLDKIIAQNEQLIYMRRER